MELTSVARFGLPDQAWAGLTPPDPSRIQIQRTQGPKAKPNGALFTSSWHPAERSSAWLGFMRTTGSRGDEGRRLWILVPDPGTTLLVLDSVHKYEQLAEEYPQRHTNPRNPISGPDWFGIACAYPRPFDAVHVTDEAARVLNGWDVESTAWFDLEPFRSWRCEGPIDGEWRLAAD